MPFLRSIFDPFLDFSWTRICLFYGTFWISRCLFGPFLDGFLTVHFIVIFVIVGFVCLVAVLASCQFTVGSLVRDPIVGSLVRDPIVGSLVRVRQGWVKYRLP